MHDGGGVPSLRAQPSIEKTTTPFPDKFIRLASTARITVRGGPQIGESEGVHGPTMQQRQQM